MRLPDDIWLVICDYVRKYKKVEPNNNVRQRIETICSIDLFEGGVFIAMGNEFDLFVVPSKRGKWKIKSTITQYLNRMHQRYDKVIVRIYEDNITSLRLAHHFGFREISREKGIIRLERQNG